MQQINENVTQDIKVGDLFYTSWGYDQTNYDYIVVIEISPTGKTVKCQRAMHENKGYSGQAYIQKPVNKPFGDVFRLKVTSWEGKPVLRGSYPFLHTGKGSKRYDSFFKVKPEATFYETDPVFGH